ncbi:MAG: hypothetical protein H6736_22650, partial [Alphaproteobacteria bacterium]|nr:hypothetical protein [Alphaproteobacteria bacterium]
MSRCALVLLVLPACGGGGPTAPGACDNGLPSAVVDVTLTGGVQQSGSFGIA